MQYNALSSFVCSEWLLCRLLASVTDCLWIQMSICPIMFCSILFPALCFFQHYVYFLIIGRKRRRSLNTQMQPLYNRQLFTKNGTSVWECKLDCGIQDGGVSIEGAAIFMNTSFTLVWWTGGQCHCIYMHLAGRGFLCLSEWFTAHRGTLAVHKMGTRG